MRHINPKFAKVLCVWEVVSMLPHISSQQNMAAFGSGLVAGLFMAVVGGGGSALAVPLMMSVVGLRSARQAMGTTAVSVALTALVSSIPHMRQGFVKWSVALGFAAFGMGGIWLGTQIGQYLSAHWLLIGLGCLMIGQATLMATRRRLSDGVIPLSGWSIWKRLGPWGFGVGLVAGIVGMGGGFLVLPGMLATGMPMLSAVGSSLVSIGALGMANGSLYAAKGLVDWRVVFAYVAGGGFGGILGAPIAAKLSKHGQILPIMAAAVLGILALYLLGSNVVALYTRGSIF